MIATTRVKSRASFGAVTVKNRFAVRAHQVPEAVRNLRQRPAKLAAEEQLVRAQGPGTYDHGVFVALLVVQPRRRGSAGIADQPLLGLDERQGAAARKSPSWGPSHRPESPLVRPTRYRKGTSIA